MALPSARTFLNVIAVLTRVTSLLCLLCRSLTVHGPKLESLTESDDSDEGAMAADDAIDGESDETMRYVSCPSTENTYRRDFFALLLSMR